jgi:hypothetical protein
LLRWTTLSPDAAIDPPTINAPASTLVGPVEVLMPDIVSFLSAMPDNQIINV